MRTDRLPGLRVSVPSMEPSCRPVEKLARSRSLLFASASERSRIRSKRWSRAKSGGAGCGIKVPHPSFLSFLGDSFWVYQS